ncbi:MAG: hypothetical protein WEB89_01835 [Balneolales bacterium]
MMNSFIKSCTLITVLWALIHIVATDFITNSAQAQDRSELKMEGEYTGTMLLEDSSEIVDVELEVVNTGGNKYQAILSYGELPQNESNSASDRSSIKMEGTYQDYTLRLAGDFPLELQFIHNRFTALDSNNNYMGHFERVVRLHSGN